MARQKKINTEGVKKAMLDLPSDEYLEISSLSLDLLKNKKGDGSVHNTLLWLLANECEIEINPFQSEVKQSHKVLLNIPVGMHHVMRYMAKQEGLNYTDFLREAILKQLKKLGYESHRQRAIADLPKIKASAVDEEEVLQLDKIEIEGKSYRLLTYPQYAEETGTSEQNLRQNRLKGGARRLMISGARPMIAVPE